VHGPHREDEAMNIHLVETENHFVKLEDNVWESAAWQLQEEEAQKLVGGKIFFHKKKQEPSFYGGTIPGFRVTQEGETQGKVIFKLQYSFACRNVSTDRFGWNKAMKITEIEYQEPLVPPPEPKIPRTKTGGKAKRFPSSGKSR
jgi:predicted secreted protein